MKKRIAAVLLVFTLLGGMLPAVAWGEYSPHEGSPGYYLHDGTSPDEAYFAEPPQQVMEFVFAYLQANHASVAGGAVGRGLGQVVDETVSHPLGDFTVMHFVIENSVLHMDILVQLDFVPYSTDYVMDMPFLHFHVRNPHAVLYYAALCEYGYEMQAAPPVSVNFTGRGDGEFMLSVEQVLWSGEDALAELEVYFEAFSITRHCRTCFLSQEILREDLGLSVFVLLDESRILTTAFDWAIGRTVPSRDGNITIDRILINHLGTEIFTTRTLEADDPVLEFSMRGWNSLDFDIPEDMTNLIAGIYAMVEEEDFSQGELEAIDDLILMLLELAAQDDYVPIGARSLVEIRVNSRAVAELAGLSVINADELLKQCIMTFAPITDMYSLEILVLQADGSYLRVEKPLQ